jgi:hypothetical protein
MGKITGYLAAFLCVMISVGIVSLVLYLFDLSLLGDIMSQGMLFGLIVGNTFVLGTIHMIKEAKK